MKFGNENTILYLILLGLSLFDYGDCTTLNGSFEVDQFFKFLVKFGFQKTERHSQKDSFGYIFGNITSNDEFTVPITLAVLDKYHFLEFYKNSTIQDRHQACRKMFARLNVTAYDKPCNVEGKGDYLRKIPCKGAVCTDEDSPKNLIPGSQFTFVISNLNQPRFWYLSIVSCYRNPKTCEWEYYDHSKLSGNSSSIVPTLNYQITIVNGLPTKLPFIYHFSFDQQNIFEMCLIFFFIYCVIVPIQIYTVRIQIHPLTKLFTISLMLEFISICFILIHLIKFSMNGVGNENLKITGDIFDILSRTSFMLVLLLLAKGWAVTRLEISRISWAILILVWLSYCSLNIVLYVWNRTEVDVVSDIDEYQTWPGWLVLISRSMIMIWFLYELRTTMKYEHSTKKLDFLLHFGASSLVWFIYLPIIALIALQVSPFWRYKLLLAVTNSVDCLGYCIILGLLWPHRSGQYLLLTGPSSAIADELDEFNEAPHIVNREIYSRGDSGLDPLDDDDEEELVISREDLLSNGMNSINSENLLILGEPSHFLNHKSSNILT